MEQRIPDSRKQQARYAESGERVVLVVTPEETTRARDEITLSELWNILWSEKWTVIAVSILAMIASVAYALLATQWWRAEVLLVPVSQKGTGVPDGLGALGGLAGLASIAGISLGDDDAAEPIAVLQSGDFTRSFVEEQKLLPVLFHDQWDASAGRWKGDDPKEWPDDRDAVRLFEKKIRQVDVDKQTGLVTLTIDWTDPVLAANWANLLVDRVNERMRMRALGEADHNIKYLRRELTGSNIVTLQQSLGRLLENEMHKMMVARGSTEYSFRFVDRAEPPKWRSRPKRALVVILGTLAGAILAVFAALSLHSARKRTG
jgi:uncharacterized protein involved in exopolysaccharide biosynthesis